MDNILDPLVILKKIIENDGNCEKTVNELNIDGAVLCSMCPMSKTITRPDGSYISCLEYIQRNYKRLMPNSETNDTFNKYLNLLYKTVLEEHLITLELERMIIESQ